MRLPTVRHEAGDSKGTQQEVRGYCQEGCAGQKCTYSFKEMNDGD